MRTLAPFLLLAAAANAALDHIEISERKPVLDGRGYEVIIGTAHFTLDPKNDANRIIVDIDRAPAGPDGKVRFSADLYALKPPKPNGTALLEVNNRGNKGMVAMFSFAKSSLNPQTAAELGDQ